MSTPQQHLPLYTVDEYLRLERAAQERHEYVDGHIYLKVDEYLKLERDSLDRHEYVDGHIYLMAGESLPHGYITVNLFAIFHDQLKGTPCATLTKDAKVRSGPTPMPGESMEGLFSYPDLLIVCGGVEFHDAFKDVVVNPRVVLEVLSTSTEKFDRIEKLERCKKWNSSLTDYLLVSQESAQIEHHQRRDDGVWNKEVHSGLEEAVVIPSIQCTVNLADVYDRVTLDKA